jgi:hypothetical protein
VDLFCWGIYRKYERKDEEWYAIFKHTIVFEEIYSEKAAPVMPPSQSSWPIIEREHFGDITGLTH